MAAVHLSETLEHHVYVWRSLSTRDVREMIDWCKLPDYPGRFSFHYEQGTIKLVFEFTDPNVAFEFKMRFG